MTTLRRRAALLCAALLCAALAPACSGDIRVTGAAGTSTSEPGSSSSTGDPTTGTTTAPTTGALTSTDGSDSGSSGSSSGGATTLVDTTGATTGPVGSTGEPGSTGGLPDLPPGCESDSLFIYLLDIDGALHRFQPETLELTGLGKPTCDADPPLPMAMTIDRLGDAWMYYADRKVYRVDTDTLVCEATPHVPPPGDEFVGFGLSFSADAVDSPDDTLYFSGLAGPIQPTTPAGLGRAVGDALAFELIGPIDDLKSTAGLADLTGTGDARLFGFFNGDSAVISEIDKQTGKRIDPWVLDGFGTGSPWAFAFYAGEFWLFTSTGGLGNTAVTTFDPGTQTLTPRVDDLGLKIVGAGVSTCVPVLPQ